MSRQWKSIVVVIVDPHRAEQAALAKAAAMAERAGARVTLLNTFMVPAPPAKAMSTEDVLQTGIQERLVRLGRLARTLERRGVAVDCAVEWDFPVHEAIVRYVLKHGPDLLIAESHHHNPLARMFLANTDWELIRACPCPVWFVRARKLPAAPKVLVAVDPRHTHAKPAKLDDRLLAAANRLTGQLGGEVCMAHVCPGPAYGGATIMEPIRWPTRGGGRVDAATKALVDRLGARHGVKPANRVLQVGDATEVLPTIAKKVHADVLVMGAVSRSRTRQYFIGNTAEKVIDHVDCDVLIVKPANFKTPVKRARRKL